MAEPSQKYHILDLFAIPPVYNIILENLDTLSLIKLTSTCHAFRSVGGEVWNLDRLLRRYVDNYSGFRSLMREYNAGIGGSSALAFFMRTFWEDSDLDLYVEDPDAQGLRAFACLLKKEGYRFIHSRWQPSDLETAISKRPDNRRDPLEPRISVRIDDDPNDSWDPRLRYDSRRISAVFNFQKEKKKIQIMLTLCAPIACIIDDYYATHIMNMLTADKAYCLFPMHTLVKKVGYITSPGSVEGTTKGIQRYENRGFETRGYKETHPCGPRCPTRQHRSVDDSYSWIMNLSPAADESDSYKLKLSATELCSFGLAYKCVFDHTGDTQYYPRHLDFPGATTDDEKAQEILKRQGAYLTVELDLFANPLLLENLPVNFMSGWKQYLDDCLGVKTRWANPHIMESDVESPWLAEAKQAGDYLDHLVPKWYKTWMETQFAGSDPLARKKERRKIA